MSLRASDDLALIRRTSSRLTRRLTVCKEAALVKRSRPTKTNLPRPSIGDGRAASSFAIPFAIPFATPFAIPFAISLAVFCSGCQTLSPFANKTRSKIAAATQWANGGIDAAKQGRWEQAKNLFTRAAEQNPTDYRVHANLARTLHQSGDQQQAILKMQEAVELSHNDTRLLVELGEMYLEAQQWLPARRQVDLALAANHHFAPAWVLRGKTEKAKGNYENALADFQRALGYAPDMNEVQLEIIETYQRLEQPLKVLSAVEQLLSKLPADAQPERAILAKSSALIAMNQLAPSIDILQVASRRPSASSEIFIQLSKAELLAGQPSQARLTLNRGKQNFPDLPIFDRLSAELQAGQKRVAAAESTLFAR